MADATASMDGNGRAAAMPAQRVSTGHAATAVVVSEASADALAKYAAFCGQALHAPAQGAHWARHWTRNVNADALIATLSVDQKPVLALALEVVRAGPFRIARFMGGRHANGNFSAADRAWLGKADCAAIRSLFDAIAAARPDIDVLALQRLASDLDGAPNPFMALSGFTSPNVSLAADLDGGFDAVLDRASGRRKRKKHRSQIRKFEAAGGFRRVEATTPEQVGAFLDAFFSMKEQRLRRMGITDAFRDPDVRRFFHSLFTDALHQQPPSFVLHGLEVDGRLRAVTGTSVCGDRLICEFAAISEDELTPASPGEFLFFGNIEEACARGFRLYDFSVGDERYKREWCNLETRHRDVLVPLTTKGRVLALTLHGCARVTAFVKNSPMVWRLTKALRRKAAGKPCAQE